MSQNLTLEDNKVINTTQTIDVNSYFLYALETADNLNSFCDYCIEMLDNIKIKHLIILQKNNDTENKVKIVYQKSLAKEKAKKLSLIEEIIKQKIDLEPPHNCYVEQSSLTEKKQDNIYIRPLVFKKYELGYLYLETELDKDYLQNISNKTNKINLVSKYITLYLYHQIIEKKQEKLKQEEKRLQEIQKNQNQYLSHINHELRTPIAAIIGFSKMLHQKLYGELNPKQSQYIDAIYQSGTYLLELISDLLDITKIQAQKEELFIEKILVEELCQSSLALVKNKAEEQNINLNLEINSDVNYCFADQRKLKQILVNLLSNGIKFTEKGSVTLSVIKTDNNFLFKVIDTGIGIDKESQAKLFQPFAQLHNHLQNKHRGSGLGLVISRELARLHGGDITLQSEKNKGSCFTLSLPINLKPSRLNN